MYHPFFVLDFTIKDSRRVYIYSNKKRKNVFDLFQCKDCERRLRIMYTVGQLCTIVETIVETTYRPSCPRRGRRLFSLRCVSEH